MNTFIQQEHIQLREKRSELWHKSNIYMFFFLFQGENKIARIAKW